MDMELVEDLPATEDGALCILQARVPWKKNFFAKAAVSSIGAAELELDDDGVSLSVDAVPVKTLLPCT